MIIIRTMDLPFSTTEFLEIFATYNTAVWPAQILFYALALLAIVLAARMSSAGKSVTIILVFLWAWMGLVYHIGFFTSINKAAYGFGALFVVQALLLLYAGIVRRDLAYSFKGDPRSVAGAVLLAYALIVYPLLGIAFGHSYPQSPTFGLPCPTTIFTFGLLLWCDRRMPWWLLIIPVLWSLIGTIAALKLGVTEDLGLQVAAVTAVVFQIKTRRRSTLSMDPSL